MEATVSTFLLVLSLIVSAAARASAATIQGKVTSAGVVWVSDGSKLPPGPDQIMGQTNKTFVPDFLVVNAGGSVRFPNNDNFYHSVYSASTADPFDIGFYDTGPGKLVSFPHAGTNAITCHIHVFMHGTIVVVDGPSARTTSDGAAFTLENVRPGNFTLHVWTPAGGEHAETVRVAGAKTRVVLDHAL